MQSDGTNMSNREQINRCGDWNVVTKGPPRVSYDNNTNTKFKLHHNRYNDLAINDHIDFQPISLDQNISPTKEKNSVNVNKRIHHAPQKDVTIRRKPNPVVNLDPERDRLSEQIFNNRINQPKKIRIMTDSIAKGIRVKDFNNHLENGNARFKTFPGASIGNLNYYINPTLEQEKPEVVVIHVGINDLLSENLSNASDQVIADQIIEIGKKCTHYGVEKVFISALVTCKSVNPNRITIINDFIKVRCDFYGFDYIGHNNIKDEHLWKDGIHLRENGKVILAQNVLDFINNFLDQNGYAQGWD